MSEKQCEGCGGIGKEYVKVCLTNGALTLCRECLDEFNGKNQDLAAERQARQAAEQRADKLAKERDDWENQVDENILRADKAEADAAAMRRESQSARDFIHRHFCEQDKGGCTIGCLSLSKCLSTQSGRALAAFIERLRAAPCEQRITHDGRTCPQLRPPDLWCVYCQSRSPNFGGSE